MVKAFDIETTKSPRHFPWIPGSYIVSASVVYEDGTRKSWLFNHPESKQSLHEAIEEFKHELVTASRLVAHNAKFDMLWLLHLGLRLHTLPPVFCTQVAEYLIKGQSFVKGELTLEALSKQYGIPSKIDKVKLFWDSGYETDEIPAKILEPYCLQDTANALAVYQHQIAVIRKMGMEALCTLQCEETKVLATAEYNGMLIDKQKAEGFSAEYGEKINAIDNELGAIIQYGLHTEGTADDVVGTFYNPGSGQHFSALLYGGVIRFDTAETYTFTYKDGRTADKVRKVRREVPIRGLGFVPPEGAETATEGYYKTDVETLKGLKCTTKEQSRFLELMYERSRYDKLKSTYFDGVLKRMMPDDYIHPSLNQTVTITGRLSSSNPNGQNMPRDGTGPVKHMFITRYKEE